MLKLDEKQLKAVHSKTNLRRFLDYVNHSQVEKITKMCSKGLDPNFHCQESGGELIHCPFELTTIKLTRQKIYVKSGCLKITVGL
jgi:hypothetical protein